MEREEFPVRRPKLFAQRLTASAAAGSFFSRFAAGSMTCGLPRAARAFLGRRFAREDIRVLQGSVGLPWNAVRIFYPRFIRPRIAAHRLPRIEDRQPGGGQAVA